MYYVESLLYSNPYPPDSIEDPRYAQLTTEELFSELVSRDSGNVVNENNRRKIITALKFMDVTGFRFSEQNRHLNLRYP